MRVLVTGANSGMGKATVAAMADKGYEVIMLCRNESRGWDAYEELRKENIARNIKLMFCDLGNFASIRKFAEDFRGLYDSLDVRLQNRPDVQKIWKQPENCLS